MKKIIVAVLALGLLGTICAIRANASSNKVANQGIGFMSDQSSSNS